MAEVTDIKQQIKRKDRYSVFIDGKYSFALSESGLLSSGLKIGLELSDVELHDLKKVSAEDRAVYKVMDLLARRPRSKWEIEDYLRRKNCSSEEIEKVLDYLSLKDYVNDKKFAERWVENRRLLKPISLRRLKLELKQKRVSEEVIEDVLGQGINNETATIKDLIRKKQKQTRYEDKQKLVQFLARQGFNYSDIKQAFEELGSKS